MRLKKCESDFCFRACQLASLFNYCKVDFLIPNHKNKLQVYKALFWQIYSETNPCTWRLLCDCSTCKETMKLKKTLTTTAIVKEHAHEWVLTKPLDICPKSFYYLLLCAVLEVLSLSILTNFFLQVISLTSSNTDNEFQTPYHLMRSYTF